jgi:hypothetical protein
MQHEKNDPCLKQVKRGCADNGKEKNRQKKKREWYSDMQQA